MIYSLYYEHTNHHEMTSLPSNYQGGKMDDDGQVRTVRVSIWHPNNYNLEFITFYIEHLITNLAACIIRLSSPGNLVLLLCLIYLCPNIFEYFHVEELTNDDEVN